MRRSIQKNMQPPIKLAITVDHNAPIPDKKWTHNAKIGVDNCQRIKYNTNFFFILSL